MKIATDRPFAEPEKAAHELIEIASTVKPVQDGRIPIELVNTPLTCKPVAVAVNRTRAF